MCFRWLMYGNYAASKGFSLQKFLTETCQINFFFLFLISSSKREHSFLKLAKDGFVPWYRYKLVKSNTARSRELAFGTLLGNETTESGKTQFTAWYQLQFSIDSAKVFGNQLPNTSLGITLAHSLGQSGYFSNLLKECLVHLKNVPAQEGSFTGYSWQREKRAWGETNPSLQLIRCSNSLEETCWFQQQPASTSRQRCHTAHPVPQDIAFHRVTPKLGNTDQGVLHCPTSPEMPSRLLRKSPPSKLYKTLLVYVTLQTWGCFERTPKHTRVWAIHENEPEFQLYRVSLWQSSVRYH